MRERKPDAERWHTSLYRSQCLSLRRRTPWRIRTSAGKAYRRRTQTLLSSTRIALSDNLQSLGWSSLFPSDTSKHSSRVLPPGGLDEDGAPFPSPSQSGLSRISLWGLECSRNHLLTQPDQHCQEIYLLPLGICYSQYLHLEKRSYDPEQEFCQLPDLLTTWSKYLRIQATYRSAGSLWAGNWGPKK